MAFSASSLRWKVTNAKPLLSPVSLLQNTTVNTHDHDPGSERDNALVVGYKHARDSPKVSAQLLQIVLPGIIREIRNAYGILLPPAHANK